MSSSFDKLFDPERLSERWQLEKEEAKAPEIQLATPTALRDFQALRLALADHCKRSEGMTILVDQAWTLTQALHPPDPELKVEQIEELKAQLVHVYEELEDLLEALEVSNMYSSI
jgi:hypothetical protein